ncbi:hypothetical protein GO730_16740 [Spirosoma sp. HMF3257]|uniref:hypothetical protein n=1 Tax=Spirosoma telluris TaxID=2183553 RepID=UPI0011B942E9|nr:hypothetical protein [Spirosoma telluris]
MFPNPVVSTLTVRICGLPGHQSARLELLDLNEQVLLHWNTQRETTPLLMDEYPASSYLA